MILAFFHGWMEINTTLNNRTHQAKNWTGRKHFYTLVTVKISSLGRGEAPALYLALQPYFPPNPKTFTGPPRRPNSSLRPIFAHAPPLYPSETPPTPFPCPAIASHTEIHRPARTPALYSALQPYFPPNPKTFTRPPRRQHIFHFDKWLHKNFRQ